MDKHQIIIILIPIFTCCSGSGPNRRDADPDPDLDSDGDQGDADRDAATDGDADEPDSTPPVCDDLQPEAHELSPAPNIASQPHLAPEDLRFAAVWLQGEESPFDIVITTVDSALEPEAPITVAAARPHAARPILSWLNNVWVVVWAEAESEEACADEEACDRTLFLARVDRHGATITEATPLWPGTLVADRVSLVPTANTVWTVFTGNYEGNQRTLAGRLGPGSAVGDLVQVVPDQSARRTSPGGVLFDDSVIVISAISPLGLVATALDPDTGELTAGPETIVADIAASTPTVATDRSNLGVVYLANRPDTSSPAVFFVEVGSDLAQRAPPVPITTGEHWPKAPQVGAAASGWVAAWYDGREDRAEDCVVFGFCRDDIFFQPLSLTGPVDVPIRLSEDPNDCEAPSVVVTGSRVAIGWSTYRDNRPTAFVRTIMCD